MDSSLITILIAGVMICSWLVYTIIQNTNKSFSDTFLPKLSHKIVAISIGIALIFLGFFLGKFLLKEPPEDSLASTQEKEESSQKDFEPEYKNSINSYIREMKNLIRKEKYKKAAYLITDTINISPENPPMDLHDMTNSKSRISEAYLYRAYAFKKIEKWSLSIANYTAAMYLADSKHWAYYNQHIADVYRQSGEYKAALLEYEDVLRDMNEANHPFVNMVNVYYGMGDVLEKQGLTKRALEAYQNAQIKAFDNNYCKCYPKENNIKTPSPCLFEPFDKFDKADEELVLLKGNFRDSCLIEFPRPRVSRTKVQDRIEILKTRGRYRSNKPSPQASERIKRLYNEQEAYVRSVQSRQKRIVKESKQKIKIWEQDFEACMNEKLKQLQTAKNRVFSPESSLAFTYLKRGELYFKNEMSKDSTINDFIKLFTLCDFNMNGACSDLKSLLGASNYRKVRSLLANKGEEEAKTFLSQILENITIPEKTEIEEDKWSFKSWMGWLMVSLIGIETGIIIFLLIRLKRRRSTLS